MPQCPRHRSSKVVRVGWYGTPGNRRQRWLCKPKAGQPHKFSEQLPRVVRTVGPDHVCPECSTELEPWEGQAAARLYGFTAREVAAALVAVANGASYRAAAASARLGAGRPLSDKSSGKTPKGQRLEPANRHGQLVSDWVLVFAPVIWAAYAARRPERWLALDDTTLMVLPTGATRSVRAFCVLAVVGSDPTVSPGKVVAVRAFPRRDAAAWRATLRPLATPDIVVGDGGTPLPAAQKLWPTAQPRRCEWHLRKNLTDALPAQVVADPDDPLHGLIRNALRSPADFLALQTTVSFRHANARGYTNLASTLATLTPVAAAQLTAKAQPGGLAGPHSVGATEQFLQKVRATLAGRAHRMTNKPRADALLTLLAAAHNGWADELAWADLIRAHLANHHGRPAHNQRHRTDPAWHPSLR